MQSYFLGIRLPRELEKEVEAWRRQFRAPKTPAHITLIPPFNWAESEEHLVNLVHKIEAAHKPFEIEGQGIGNFGKAVLFVNVELSKELVKLQQSLADHLEPYGIARETRPYHPHITLATRLRPDKFVTFQGELEDYHPKYQFPFEKVTVFKIVEHDYGRRWIDLDSRR